MKNMQRRLACMMAGAFGLAMALPAVAQLSAGKPIRLIAPFGAGSSGDIAARVLGVELGELTGVPVLVENIAGADGIIGAKAVKAAAPDGHTLLVASSSQQVLNAFLYKDPGYDAMKDFVPVAPLMTAPLQFWVRTDSRFSSIADIIKAARQGEGKVSFGSATATQRLAGEMFNQMAGVKMLYVPYRTTVAAMTDLAAGRIDVGITETASAGPFKGKIKPLAAVISKRMTSMPDLPTVEEAGGLKGYNVTAFYGVWAPAGTPAATVNRLAELIAKAKKTQRMRDLLTTVAGEAFDLEPAEFRQFQINQTEKIGAVVRSAGIEPQ